jgi:hypothetical protein
MKITMDGRYQTRDEESVRIFSLNGPDPCFPVVGAIEGSYVVHTWRLDGRAIMEGKDDLIPVPEDYQMWVVVGRKPNGYVYVKVAWNIQDVWVLDSGDVLLARKMVEIKEGYFDHEEHTP